MSNKHFTFLISFLIAVTPLCLQAQSNLGTAHYAMLSPNWPCKEIRGIEANQKVLRKSVLWNTFGTDTSCLTQYFSDKRLEVFELHLINEACIRNGRCGAYEFLYGLTPAQYQEKLLANDAEFLQKIRSYAQTPANLINTNLKPYTKCYISPGLESNLSNRAAKVLINTVRPLFPNCQIVWNPAGINKSKPIPDTVFEVHGSQVDLKPPCIANLDGEDIQFPGRPAILPNFIESSQISPYKSKYAQCDANFLWIAEDNGLSKGPFIDPRDRRNFPSVATFSLLADLLASF